ncbi:hypothetical protein ABEB36_006092 [Hypothenemus hampei]|uniref:Uncharacterized protein n=1 Tax=Hypothenemus hampei TaxID=57062 RepID=A0ABD1F348_HYPHA
MTDSIWPISWKPSKNTNSFRKVFLNIVYKQGVIDNETCETVSKRILFMQDNMLAHSSSINMNIFRDSMLKLVKPSLYSPDLTISLSLCGKKFIRSERQPAEFLEGCSKYKNHTDRSTNNSARDVAFGFLSSGRTV